MNKLRLLTPIILAVFASCASKESSENTSPSRKISYELDTVMVDAGDDIIHINWNLTTSDLSADHKYFYNFKTGSNTPGLEVIDLENLKLDHVIPMELDGPNGLRSPYVSHVYILPDGTF